MLCQTILFHVNDYHNIPQDYVLELQTRIDSINFFYDIVFSVLSCHLSKPGFGQHECDLVSKFSMS